MRFLSMILALCACLGSPALAHDGVHINQPYASVIGANAKSGAIYLRIVNHAASDDVLLSASTDAAKSTMLHQSVQDENGIMQMPAVTEGITIPGKGDFTFQHSGYHIMMMGLTRSLKQGDTFTLTLTFQNAGDIQVEVPVDNDRSTDEAVDAPMDMDMDMDHSGHTMPAPASN